MSVWTDFFAPPPGRDLTLAGAIPFKGAMVKLTTNETLTTETAIPWDAEIYDVGDWVDLGGSATRITVPTGITRARLTANIAMNSVSVDMQWSIRKNGSRFDGGGWERDGSTAAAFSYSTGVIDVIAGDYFELFPTFASGSPVLRSDISGGQHFAIEAIEAIAPSTTPRGALVKQATSFSLPNNSTTVVTWNDEVYDTDDIHDNVTDNTRLTVPTGVTHVRLSGNYKDSTNTTGWRFILVTKNGSSTDGSGSQSHGATGSGVHLLNYNSGILEVVAGDYFEMQAFQNSGGSTSLSGTEFWFAMEIVEPAVLGGNFLENIVEDTTPQLGGDLDHNTFSITSGGDDVLSFSSDGEGATNSIDISAALTSTNPTISVVGSDTNIGLDLTTKGTGVITTSPIDIGSTGSPITAVFHAVTPPVALPAIAAGSFSDIGPIAVPVPPPPFSHTIQIGLPSVPDPGLAFNAYVPPAGGAVFIRATDTTGAGFAGGAPLIYNVAVTLF